MRLGRSLLVVLAAVLVSRPAGAGRILYATAATPGRVDGFCLGNDGTPAGNPSVSITMRQGQDPGASEPRRLLVANGVLYVAEVDRVEAFRIGPGGGLGRIGGTKVEDNMRPLDLALSADGRTLYVPQTGLHRIVAYPLDADGTPTAATSCVLGPTTASFQNLAVNGSLLYVTATDVSGRVDVFRANPDGSLPNGFLDEQGNLPSRFTQKCEKFSASATAAATKERTDAITPAVSTRQSLSTPKGIALRGDVLYVEERGNNQIRAFRLHPDGLFDTPVKKFPNRPKSKALRYQKPESTTVHGLAYEALLLRGNALIASNFGKARIDTFLLRPGGKLPRTPRVTSVSDIRMTPVRIAADGNVLYVAAGEFDRVVAYRLRPNGLLAERTPFAETNEQTGSFPNDVAVAMLPEACH